MNTIETLREKLSKLISSNASGIIVLRGSAGKPADNEDFWNNHSALVYLHPLDTVMSVTPWSTSYTSSSGAMHDDYIFGEFLEVDDELSVAELGYDETQYLNICMDTLLIDMAHDDNDNA